MTIAMVHLNDLAKLSTSTEYSDVQQARVSLEEELEASVNPVSLLYERHWLLAHYRLTLGLCYHRLQDYDGAEQQIKLSEDLLSQVHEDSTGLADRVKEARVMLTTAQKDASIGVETETGKETVPAATSPPPSPTKPSLLRKLVTGVHNPVSPDEHAQRWNKSSAPVSTATAFPAVLQASVSGRVASMVNSFEAASISSKSTMASGPPSPIKVSLPASSPAPLSATMGRPSSNTAMSPTVPASFFQQQQVKRTPPPSSPIHARFAQQTPRSVASAATDDKENDTPKSASYPSPSAFPAPPSTRPIFSRQPVEPPRFAPVGSRPVSSSQDSAAASEVSVETMATRASDSTHANSNVTMVDRSSGENDTAAKGEIKTDGPAHNRAHSDTAKAAPAPSRTRDFAAPRQVIASPPLIPMPSFEKRAIAQQQHQHSQPQHHNQQQQTRQRPQTHLRQYSQPHAPQNQHAPAVTPPERPVSAFSEALPMSFPSSQPPTPSHEMPARRSSGEYTRLPLDSKPVGPPGGVTRPRRARASTLGGGLKLPTMDALETPEMREKHVNEAFGRLLDTMQLPDPTVRSKMLGLALPLKEEMLRSASTSSSASPNLGPGFRPGHSRGRSLNIEANTQPIQRAPVPILTGKKEPRSGSVSGSVKSSFLRKAKSTNSLRAASATVASSSSTTSTVEERKRPSHNRTTSASSIFRSFGRSGGSVAASATGKEREREPSDGEDATWWAVRMRSASCAVLEVQEVGKLRGRLRAEPPSWVQEFLRHGGYQGLLERLKELLDVEWREEQHDDQILHELLRCIKALSSTVCGCRALASRMPTPFVPLASLLFSEKRPGELPSRQLLVEIIQSVFDICPEVAEPIARNSEAWKAAAAVQLEALPSTSSESGSGGVRRYVRKIKGEDDEDGDSERQEVISPERRRKAHVFVHSLMQGPPNPKEEARVDFIQSTHRPRVFKLWVTEMSDIVRDYFWIFCHSQNLFWSLHQLNVEQIEAPKVPSGMTGGVEYEAMSYAASHFRLINAVASTCSSVEEAFTFHNDLFESGLERVLLTLRRASLVYYQHLHLEMSRYLALARSARFNLGPRILSCLDARTLSPEERMVVQMAQQQQQQARQQPSGAPQLGAIAFS